MVTNSGILDMKEFVIREETPADIESIRDVTVAAFQTLDISNQTEHLIIEELRAAAALALSLVAELDGQVVGHIAFSPVNLSDGTTGWYGLGPVSVLPEFHRQGIGSGLIEVGLEKIKDRGAKGCCLVGHPGYYKRFGFINPAKLSFEGVPEEAFFALAFAGSMPEGTVTFNGAFNAGG